MKPIIGIVICGTRDNFQYVSQPYIEAIVSSGGIPVLLPYISETNEENCFACYISTCDGFLFCGGDDISPLLYSEELMTAHGKTDWHMDSFHLRFMKHTLDARIPVLAICRGMQVMNLTLGGSLYQDISLRSDPSFVHMQLSENRSDPCHKITVSKSSMLYNILNDSTVVNSFHHQCIHVLGKDIRIGAIASDGVIEAIEVPAHPFALGVQWHPECMYQNNPGMQNIFSRFTEKAESAKKLLLP